MNDELIENIFNEFRTRGIKARSESTIFSLSYNVMTGEFHDDLPPDKIYPDLSEFGITDKAEASALLLQYIYLTTGVQLSTTTELFCKREHEGRPFILALNEYERRQELYFLTQKIIPGSIVLRNDNIKTLGDIEQINGDLGFSDSRIRDLGNLIEVKGHFWIAQSGPAFTTVTTLGSLEFVGGDMTIKQSPIEDLGDLTHVEEI
jgi:hypothetical protein